MAQNFIELSPRQISSYIAVIAAMKARFRPALIVAKMPKILKNCGIL
jgi:hypothetical protein